jgi:hypothetical protein
MSPSGKPSRKFSPKTLAIVLGAFVLAVTAWALFTLLDPQGPEYEKNGVQPPETAADR